MWYHISSAYLGRKKKFTPQICEYNSTTIYEEGDIPHICVSDSLFNCLKALVGMGKPDTNVFLRHFKENPCVYFTEEKAYTPPNAIDFRNNNEHWFLKPTEFRYLGRINMYRFLKESVIVPTDKEKLIIPKGIEKYYSYRTVKERFLENVISGSLKK